MAALAATLATVGCGGSSTQSSSSSATTTAPQPQSTPTQTPTPPAREVATAPAHQANRRPEHEANATIEASIAGVHGNEPQISKANTCDGADTPLPVRWGKLPHGTAEVAVFVVNVLPVNGKAFLDWAVAGLSPTLHGIPAGALPAGAVVARNSFGKVGYSICPPKGQHEIYLVRVAALPHPIPVKPGFDAQTFYETAERSSTNVGLTGGAYKRP
jgi:phosphatidylethanolamine-binding protein (PEBP) family uncharacterized protein